MRPISIGKVLTPNVKTTMYTVPTKYTGKWNLLHMNNGTSSGKKVDAWWYDKSANVEIPIIVAYSVSSGQYLQFNGGSYIVLEEGDEIRVRIESGATDAGAVVTVELEPKLGGQFNGI
jgi:glutamine amidotransferase-like uncharacterized protein